MGWESHGEAPTGPQAGTHPPTSQPGAWALPRPRAAGPRAAVHWTGPRPAAHTGISPARSVLALTAQGLVPQDPEPQPCLTPRRPPSPRQPPGSPPHAHPRPARARHGAWRHLHGGIDSGVRAQAEVGAWYVVADGGWDDAHDDAELLVAPACLDQLQHPLVGLWAHGRAGAQGRPRGRGGREEAGRGESGLPGQASSARRVPGAGCRDPAAPTPRAATRRTPPSRLRGRQPAKPDSEEDGKEACPPCCDPSPWCRRQGAGAPPGKGKNGQVSFTGAG